MTAPPPYQDTGRNEWFSAAPIVRRTPADVPAEDGESDGR